MLDSIQFTHMNSYMRMPLSGEEVQWKVTVSRGGRGWYSVYKAPKRSASSLRCSAMKRFALEPDKAANLLDKAEEAKWIDECLVCDADEYSVELRYTDGTKKKYQGTVPTLSGKALEVYQAITELTEQYVR